MAAQAQKTEGKKRGLSFESHLHTSLQCKRFEIQIWAGKAFRQSLRLSQQSFQTSTMQNRWQPELKKRKERRGVCLLNRIYILASNASALKFKSGRDLAFYSR